MSFSASQKNINSILSGNFEYIIPRNQRKYIWGFDEWEELFEDVFEIEQSLDYCHFIGSFVFSNIKNASNKFEIIDGQQRLITITLLFCALANRFNEIGEQNKANWIFDSFVFGNEEGEEYSKVSRDEETFFLTFLSGFLKSGFKTNAEIKIEYETSFKTTDSYNLSFLNCFLYFSEKINSFFKAKKKSKSDCLTLLSRKLSEVQTIEIIVDSEVDGYRIFETLNARGIPLEQHELIKNFIYSYLRTKTGREKVATTWSRIISNLTTTKTEYLSTFVRHYCIHLYGKIKRNTEFKVIRSNTNKKDVELLLNSLSICSKFYSFFINPEKIKETKYFSLKIYTALNFFKKMNIIQVRPLLLSLFEIFDEDVIKIEELGKYFETLEIFYFIYIILGKNTTNTIDNLISSSSKRIHDNKFCNCDEIFSSLKVYLQDYDSVRLSFTKLGYSHHNKKFNNTSNKRVIDYVFSKIENSFSNNDEHANKIPSIEHILDDSSNIEEACLIGNLLPLSSTLNNKCKEKNYVQKLKIYSQSSYNLCKKFVEFNSNKEIWGINDINTRSLMLFDNYFKNLWWNKLFC